MESEDVGAVPLVEGDRLVGMVTDRDIVVRAIAKGKDPRGMPAGEVSSRELLTVSPDDDLADALTLMAQYQVRRLAVTAEDDRLVGVISQADMPCKGKTRTPARSSGTFRDSRKARAHPDLHPRLLSSEAPKAPRLRYCASEPRECNFGPQLWNLLGALALKTGWRSRFRCVWCSPIRTRIGDAVSTGECLPFLRPFAVGAGRG